MDTNPFEVCLLVLGLLLVHQVQDTTTSTLLPVLKGLTPFPIVTPPKIPIRLLDSAIYTAEKNFIRRAEFEEWLKENGETLDKETISTLGRHYRFTRMHPESLPIDRNNQIYEETTKLLTRSFNLSTAENILGLRLIELAGSGEKARYLEGACRSMFASAQCDPHQIYRTPDGSCNNQENVNWGRSYTCFQRLLPPVYADGISTLRTAISGNPLPNPRVISHFVHRQMDKPTFEYSLMTMQFGQLVNHEVTFAAQTRASNSREMIQCCPRKENNVYKVPPLHPECVPFELPADDPFFGPLGETCHEFVRTVTCASDCRLGPREQTNQNTAYIDASTVYGSNENNSLALREFRGGRLLIQDTKVGPLLPPSPAPSTDQCSTPIRNTTCFLSGDARVNQHPALTSIHIIFHRQHNRIASYLNKIYPQANDEFLYQEARRIVGAQMQAIVYGEFLPVVLGKDYYNYFNLALSGSGYTEYNPQVEPSVVHEFSTAAFRFGHSLVDNIFPEFDKKGRHIQDLELQDNFFFPFNLFFGQLDPLLRGMVVGPSQSFDRYLADAVRNHMYRPRDAAFGMDLASLDIQRGRDHGLHPYIYYVDYCFNIKIHKFSDLQQFMSERNLMGLKDLYESVYDIDLWVGGLSEKPLEGGAIGPTLGCIVGLQFYHLKLGDRFYFEHGKQAGSFTPDQLNEIRNTRISRIICANTGIQKIPIDSFRPTSEFVLCDSLPDVNMDYW